MNETIRRCPVPAWISLLFLGLSLLALPGLLPRLEFEARDRKIELVVDGQGFLAQARALGWNPPELARALAETGITSVALRPRSLADLVEEGLLQPLPTRTGTLRYHPATSLDLGATAERLARFVPAEAAGEALEVHATGTAVRELRVLVDQDLEAAFREAGLEVSYRLKNSGLRHDYPEALLEAVGEDSLVIFDDKEALGYPAALREVGEAFARKRLRVGLVEFAGQRGVQSLARAGSLRMQSVHSIPDDEMEKYPLTRVLPRWARAASERRIRVFYLNPFPLHNLPFHMKAGLEANLQYLRKVVQTLEARGYAPGAPLDPHQEIRPSPWWSRLAACLAAGIAVAWVLTFFRLLPPGLLVLAGLLAGLALALGGGARGAGGLANLVALAAACTAPAAAVLTLHEFTVRRESPVLGLLVGIPLTYLVCVAAGVDVATLLGDPGYLTRVHSFRGVKLVYLGPLALVGAYHLYRVNYFQRRLRSVELGMLGLAALLGVVYLMRSGNFSPIPASGAEHRMRDTLERILPYRPRTKELAVGYPGLGVLVSAASVGDVFWAGWGSLGATVAGVSATNSFCHLKTPFLASAGRGLVGLLFGLPLALLALGVHRLLLRREPRTLWVVAGYAGYGNIGDDWITRNLLRELRSRCPEDVELVLLTASPERCREDFGVRGVDRFDLFGVLQVLRHADFFCTGPGGLVQDRTSRRSPWYYLSLHFMARLVGVPRTGFLGEGFGPLRSSWALSLLRFYTASADLCLVRDPGSRALVGDHAQVAPDASLWPTPREPRSGDPTPGGPIGLVLRDHPERGTSFVAPLARALAAWIREEGEGRQVHLLPAFPPEDAGLTEELAEVLEQAGVAVHLTPLNSREARDLLPQLAALVSMRLHGCLLAFQEGVPLLALPYDPKVKALVEVAGYPWSRDPLGPPEEIIAGLRGLLADPEICLETLESGRERLQAGRERVGPALDALLAPVRTPL